MSKKTMLIALVMYVLSATVSFTFLYAQNKRNSVLPGEGAVTETTGDGTTALGNLLQLDPSAPRDQECPLNGKMFTQAERDAWEKRRPSAVMIENAPDARPQSGLGSADIVFEAVAEGGITRFMAIYYCGAQANDIILAPVRSARTYFVDYASGFNRPLYTHIGGANLAGPADALGQISDYGWQLQNDINGLFTIAYPYFVRNENRLGREVDTEHTVETTTEFLWQIGEKRKWTNMSPEQKVGKTVKPAADWKAGYTPWTFEKEPAKPGDVKTVVYDFWSGYDAYKVQWNYDSTTNAYKRVMGNEPHIDLNTNQQIAVSNVALIITTEKGPIDEVKHMLYGTTGTGDALIFKNGEAIKGRWTKKDRESELRFTDSKGKDLPLARGMTWISVIGKANTVTY